MEQNLQNRQICSESRINYDYLQTSYPFTLPSPPSHRSLLDLSLVPQTSDFSLNRSPRQTWMRTNFRRRAIGSPSFLPPPAEEPLSSGLTEGNGHWKTPPQRPSSSRFFPSIFASPVLLKYHLVVHKGTTIRGQSDLSTRNYVQAWRGVKRDPST